MKHRLLALLLILSGVAAAAPPKGLPFLHDDYTKALAQARQRNVPIFVECWAPW